MTGVTCIECYGWQSSGSSPQPAALARLAAAQNGKTMRWVKLPARYVMRVTPRLTRAACGHEYRSKLVVSNAVRWDKAKNPIFWVGANLGVRRHVPDYCLTNGICGLDYRLLVVLDTTRLRLAPNIDPASDRSQCGDHQRKSNTALHRGTADAQSTHALQAERSRIARGPLRWQRSR